MKKAIVFPAGHGIPYVIEAPDGFDWDLSWVAKQLGCEWIEIVRPRRLPEGFIMLVDEEGLLKPNELNPVGSWFYQTDKHGEPIVGNVMIVKEVPGDEGPEIDGMSEEDVQDIFNLIGKED